MKNQRGLKFVSGALLGATVLVGGLSTGGCSSASQIAAAASGCDEFNNGGIASLSIDAKTKAFVQAAADLQGVATSMEASVSTACINIATDLGVADTWSAKSSPDDKLTEACNQANAKIQAIMTAAAAATVTISLGVSGGQCTVDAQAQVNCEGQCKADVSCTEPDISVRCQPGDLSVQCSGTCNASATCEGSVNVEAACQGSCSAECEGECDVSATAPQVTCEGTCAGNCTGTCDGNTATGASCAGVCKGKCDATCTITGGVKAHCEGSCKGKCTGSCKLDANANINCGAMVACKGGCTGTATAPSCEGKLTPPKCMGDANCQASCSGSAEVKAQCTPPVVTLDVVGSTTGDVQLQVTALITTIQKNLPAIVLAAKTQGPLAIDAAGAVVSAGAAVGGEVGSLGGKAVACVGAAVSATAKASVSVNVSVQASASVSGSASGSSH